MDNVFDELTALISAPAFDWRPVAVKLLGNALTGIAIGFGIAAGLALAG